MSECNCGIDLMRHRGGNVAYGRNPFKIAVAINIARRTILIARQNVIFAIFVKVLVLVLAGFGIATMWMAVFADVGVTALVILNAMRTLKKQYTSW